MIQNILNSISNESATIVTIKEAIISTIFLAFGIYLLILLLSLIKNKVKENLKLNIYISTGLSMTLLILHMFNIFLQPTQDPIRILSTSTITGRFFMIPIYWSIPLLILTKIQRGAVYYFAILKKGLIFRNHKITSKNSKKWGIFILVTEALSIITNCAIFFMFIKTPTSLISVYGAPFLIISTTTITLTIYIGAKLIQPDFF